jgi:hypothetical protein
MIETALKVFDAMQIRSNAERQWHRVSLWLATLILLRLGICCWWDWPQKSPEPWQSGPLLRLL